MTEKTINKVLICILCIIGLVGCTSTLNQKFKIAYGTVKVAKMTNITLLEDDVISSQEGAEIQANCVRADDMLNIAWKGKKISADSAATQIERTYKLLDVISAKLKEKDTTK